MGAAAFVGGIIAVLIGLYLFTLPAPGCSPPPGDLSNPCPTNPTPAPPNYGAWFFVIVGGLLILWGVIGAAEGTPGGLLADGPASATGSYADTSVPWSTGQDNKFFYYDSKDDQWHPK